MGLHFGAGGPFWGSVLVPMVRFGISFWCRWSVLGLRFGAGGSFWGSVLVPVVRFGARFWCRWSVLGLDFGAGDPFWGSILVPVVRFGAPFWCRWSVLGLHFGAGGSFWGSILVPVVRFGAPFWCRWSVLGLDFGAGGPFWGSILVPVVRFGDPFSGASFLDLLWLRGASVLDLLWLPGPRFWTSSGFGLGARFWTSSCGFVLGPSRPTISESPYICFKSSNHPLFASLAFVFPFAPPSLYLQLQVALQMWFLNFSPNFGDVYALTSLGAKVGIHKDQNNIHLHCLNGRQNPNWTLYNSVYVLSKYI